MQEWPQPISLSDCHPERSRPSGVAKDLHLNHRREEANAPTTSDISSCSIH